MINFSTFPLLFFYVLLGYAHKIKLKLMHSDKKVLEILMKMKSTSTLFFLL